MRSPFSTRCAAQRLAWICALEGLIGWGQGPCLFRGLRPWCKWFAGRHRRPAALPQRCGAHSAARGALHKSASSNSHDPAISVHFYLLPVPYTPLPADCDVLRAMSHGACLSAGLEHGVEMLRSPYPLYRLSGGGAGALPPFILCLNAFQGKVHVSVVASVTQPERVSSQITNTFTFVFAVNTAPSAAQLAALPLVRSKDSRLTLRSA